MSVVVHCWTVGLLVCGLRLADGEEYSNVFMYRSYNEKPRGTARLAYPVSRFPGPVHRLPEQRSCPLLGCVHIPDREGEGSVHTTSASRYDAPIALLPEY